MVDFSKHFETDKVMLRPLMQKDLEGFLLLTSNEELWTYFTSDLSDRQTLIKWISVGLRELRDKKRLVLTIIDKPSNKIVGSTSLGNISLRDKRAEIGWTWLGKEYQGKGINIQAKQLLLSYCFNELNMERVEFKTDVLNSKVRYTLAKIGAIEEGTLRSHTLMSHNRRRDTIFYSILKSEWPTVKRKNKWQ